MRFPSIIIFQFMRGAHHDSSHKEAHDFSRGGNCGVFIFFSLLILLVRIMQRAIILQTIPTSSKSAKLRRFSSDALMAYNQLLSARIGCSKFMEFHHKTLSSCKKNTSFNIQVVCSLIRDAWRKNSTSVNTVCVKFNVPRNCKTFSTKSNFFVELGVVPRQRIAVPIKKNRNFQRYSSLISDGWICKTYGLLPDGQIVAYLSKEKEAMPRNNVLGIDINAKHFAISILSPTGKVIYQTYFGKHIWIRRKKLMARRATLRSFGAKKKLAKLKTAEHDFVRTNLGQIVREVIKLAKRFDAEVSIENLSKFKPKGKRFNRTVMRIPFAEFKSILVQRCFDNNIPLNIVDSWHTSKWCSHCGAVGNGHATNYSLFKCKICGQIVNSDRKASLAIALKSLLERKHNPNQNCFQFSNGQVPVNGLLYSYENVDVVAVHNTSTFMESQRP